MVATVQIVEKNGTAGTNTQKDGGTVRFKNADDANVNITNPMVVPPSGSDFSFDKWLRFKVTVAPDNNISNLKMYSDGTIGFGTGVSAFAKAVAAYATPTQPTATAGYTALGSLTSGSPLDLGTAAVTGTGEKGDHAVLMLKVDNTASPGNLTAETLTFSYDET